jgi:RHS repeat-associated protein
VEIRTHITYDSLSKKKTMHDPDMGAWSYIYDKSGNLTSQTDAKNQVITFDNYDGLNRLTQKTDFNSNPAHAITYAYDVQYESPPQGIPNIAIGKLGKVRDTRGSEINEELVLQLDVMQRVKKSQKTVPASNPVIFEKTYDSAGRVISLTYPVGSPSQKTFSYEYDVAGNLLYVKEGATQYVTYSGFTALGQPQTATFSNSVTTSYGYYPQTGRLYTLLTQKSGANYQNLTYQYDPKGNISTLTDSVNGITHNYGYDSLDRLTSAAGAGPNAYSQSYAYDRIGNITNKSDVGTYSYGNYSVKPHAVQSAGPFTFTYDGNGNMTSKTGGGVTTTILPQNWNYDNKATLIQKGSTTVNLTYDGNGQRVRKAVSGGSNYTVLYFGGAYEKEIVGQNTTEIFHVFAGNRRVVSVRGGNTQFYHPNHLGSASVVSGQDGSRKQQLEYYPFGDYRAEGSPQGTYDFDPAFPNVSHTFTDQEDDAELEFYNYGARLYDPMLGRFISPDSIVPSPGDPQSLNRYSYCLNNPLIYTDPSGEFIEWIIIGAIFGAFMGAVQADMAGKNIFVGALSGVVIGAASGAVGGWVGGEVTTLLAPSAQAANYATAAVAARVVGAMAGGFTGGAISGGATAAVYGGNVWQGTLYGGLAGAAMAGLVRGAIELNSWANSNLATVAQRSNPDASNMYAEPGRNNPSELPVCLDRTNQVLEQYHPDYYNPDAKVAFGDVKPGNFGETNIWTGDVTISKELAGPLNSQGQRELLEALAHEYQHSNNSVFRRVLDSVFDMTKHHYQIYLNSQNLSPQAYDAMTVGPCR